MPVTELACLRLKNNLPITDPSNSILYTNLQSGLASQAKYASATTYILSQIEDPSCIYIIGKWNSVSHHMEEWIPSSENQEIMGVLGRDLELLWVQHLDLNPSIDSGVERVPFEDTVIAIGRYFIAPGPDGKTGFEKTFNEARHHLHSFKRTRNAAGGFRADAEVDEQGDRKEEFVLLSGWDTPEEHFSFAESEGFKEFAKIKDYMSGAEIKHAKIVQRLE
ncbi:hypothetical protein BDV19DRAFT_390318 [Aspergillus venezuelensis]